VTQIAPVRTGECDSTIVHRVPIANADIAAGAGRPVAAAAGLAPSPQAAIAAMAAITRFLRMARSPHNGGAGRRAAPAAERHGRAEGSKCAVLCDHLPRR
jgi:hypothetical protein